MSNQLNFGDKVVFLNGLPLTLPSASTDPGGASSGAVNWSNLTNATLAGGNLTDTGANGSWTSSGAYTTAQGVPADESGSYTFTPLTTDNATLSGLTVSFPSISYSTINFGIAANWNGTNVIAGDYVIVENGTVVAGPFTFTNGDTLYINVSISDVVTYLHNGSTVYTSGHAASNPLFPAATLYNNGAVLRGAQISISGDSVAGDLYYNTVTNSVRYYNGSAWEPIQGSSLSGYNLAYHNIIVGNSSGLSTSVNTSGNGDILASPSTGMTVESIQGTVVSGTSGSGDVLFGTGPSMSAAAISGATTLTDAATIINASTASKVLQFSLSSMSASTTLTIVPTSTTSQSLLLPNITGNDTVVVTTLAQTLSNKTLAGPTFSGTVTVSGLTASEAVFTNGSEQLVSNPITGTGNVVMSTSPTLSGTIGGTLTFSGALTLTTSGTAFTVNNNADILGQTVVGTTTTNVGGYTLVSQGSSTSGNSFGILISAGTTTGDHALYVQNESQSAAYFRVRGDGSVFTQNNTLDNSTGNATFAGFVTVNSAEIILGDQAGAGNGAVIKLVPSNSATNWGIGSNYNVANVLEFTPSTAGGGTTFTTPAMKLTSAGNLTTTGSATFNASSTIQSAGQTTLTIANTAAGGQAWEMVATSPSGGGWNGFGLYDGTAYRLKFNDTTTGNVLTTNNTLDDGSGNAEFTGAMGVGGSFQTNWGLFVNTTGNNSNTTQVGMGVNATSGTTATDYQVLRLSPSTAAALTTLEQIAIFNASNTGAITRQTGILFASSLTAGTNNAYIADNQTYSGNYFINQTGSNPSIFGGNVTLSSTATNATIQVGGGTSPHFTLAPSSGNGYWDNSTVGSSSYFRTSNATSLDTNALFLAPSGNATFSGTITSTAGGVSTFGNTNSGSQAAVKISGDCNTTGDGPFLQFTNKGTAFFFVGSESAAANTTGTDSAIDATGNLYMYSGSTQTLYLDSSQNIVVGTAALSTSASNGFFYLETCAGTPTGTPTSYSGRTPVIIDTTNNKFWFYNGGWTTPVAASSVTGFGTGGPATIATGTTNLTSTNYGQILLCNTTTGAYTFNLPTPSTSAIFTFKDSGGNAQVKNITINRNASENIEGISASFIAQANWGSWTFVSDGTNWFVVAH